MKLCLSCALSNDKTNVQRILNCKMKLLEYIFYKYKE